MAELAAALLVPHEDVADVRAAVVHRRREEAEDSYQQGVREPHYRERR